jgi:histidinol-phosphatase (PHP family)
LYNFGIDLKKYKHLWEERDLYDTYRRYFDQVVTLAESGLFDIIGHIDLVKIFKYVPPDEDFLLQQYERTIISKPILFAKMALFP